MKPVATTSTEYAKSSEPGDAITDVDNSKIKMKKDLGGIFDCNYCNLEERYDYKGSRPPFSKAISYLEDCYIMKDPFSLPNRGEVLVIGADCSVCKKQVCLGCSLFFVQRFCNICATENVNNFPVQLHAKIKSLKKDDMK